LTLQAFPLVINELDAPCDAIQRLIANGVYLVKSSAAKETCFLHYKTDQLTLQLNDENQSIALAIDFTAGKSKHRRLYGGGKSQPLPKACGVDKHPNWTILDATAGLGKDAFVLASLGAQITLCEQHAALHALLVDALHRASNDEDTAPIVKRMNCVHNNAIDYLNKLKGEAGRCPDVIYLDPMYPERKKSAKIKKEMQVLQHLVGHTGDEAMLLESALTTAKHRVVVKRPKSASSIGGSKPSYTVASVNTRYDVYVR